MHIPQVVLVLLILFSVGAYFGYAYWKKKAGEFETFVSLAYACVHIPPSPPIHTHPRALFHTQDMVGLCGLLTNAPNNFCGLYPSLNGQLDTLRVIPTA